jgi:hypothetical protein
MIPLLLTAEEMVSPPSRSSVRQPIHHIHNIAPKQSLPTKPKSLVFAHRPRPRQPHRRPRHVEDDAPRVRRYHRLRRRPLQPHARRDGPLPLRRHERLPQQNRRRDHAASGDLRPWLQRLRGMRSCAQGRTRLGPKRSNGLSAGLASSVFRPAGRRGSASANN